MTARTFLATAAVLLAALSLSGCAVQLPEAATPEKPGFAWEDAEGGLWVVRIVPCSFGLGTAEEACNEAMALYRDGAVLRFQYGEGGPDQVEGKPHDEGARAGLTFEDAAADAAHRDEVEAVWKATHGGAAPDHVRVHVLEALRIQPSEREDTLRVVDLALQQAEPLPEPTFDCEDCTAPVYWSFGAPQVFAEQRFGSPPPGSDAWALIEDQMSALRAWLAAGPAETA